MISKLILKNRSFLFLTLAFFFSLFVIIKNCNYPIIFNNSLLKILFLKSQEESLFFNLSLSYTAAYFFYLLQTLIPQYENNHKALSFLQEEMKVLMEDIDFAIFILENMTTHASNQTGNAEITYSASAYRSNQIYYIYENSYVKRFTLNISLEKLKEKIRRSDLRIKSNAFYSLLDPFLLQEYSRINYEDILDAMEKLAMTQNSSFRLQSSKIENLKKNIASFKKNANISSSISIIPCTDIPLIEKYQKEISEYALESQEIIYSVQI